MAGRPWRVCISLQSRTESPYINLPRWITLFTTFGASNSFGVFQDFYTRSGTSSAFNISWIGSVQLFLLFSMGLVTGKLFDAGYFHYIYSLGMFLYLLSYVSSTRFSLNTTFKRTTLLQDVHAVTGGLHKILPVIPGSGSWRRVRRWFHVPSSSCDPRSLLEKTQSPCHGNRHDRYVLHYFSRCLPRGAYLSRRYFVWWYRISHHDESNAPP
jgi:hypothetical protein